MGYSPQGHNESDMIEQLIHKEVICALKIKEMKSEKLTCKDRDTLMQHN